MLSAASRSWNRLSRNETDVLASDVTMAAFKFAHDGPSIERPPARVGEHTDEVLTAVGYSAEQIAALRRSGAIA